MERAIVKEMINNLNAQLVLCELQADRITKEFESETSRKGRSSLLSSWYEVMKLRDALQQQIREIQVALLEMDP